VTNQAAILLHLLLFIACPLIVQAGIDIFSRKEYRDIIVDSLNYCIKEKELVVYGWSPDNDRDEQSPSSYHNHEN
jgi:hypothetical protein